MNPLILYFLVFTLFVNSVSFIIDVTRIIEPKPTEKCIASFTKKTIEDPTWAKEYWETVADEIVLKMEKEGIKR